MYQSKRASYVTASKHIQASKRLLHKTIIRKFINSSIKPETLSHIWKVLKGSLQD